MLVYLLNEKDSEQEREPIKGKLTLCTLLFVMISLPFLSSAYSLLGQHDTCPRCHGTGRDPGVLFLTSCPTCGGDGEVGLLMDDEDLEDVLSFAGLGVIVIAVIVGLVSASKHATK